MQRPRHRAGGGSGRGGPFGRSPQVVTISAGYNSANVLAAKAEYTFDQLKRSSSAGHNLDYDALQTTQATVKGQIEELEELVQ